MDPAQMAWDSKEMLHIFIYDYLRKHNFSRSASIMRHESGITVPGDDNDDDAGPITGHRERETHSAASEEDGFLLESWAAFWDLFTERAVTHRQTESQTARILQSTYLQPLGQNSYLDSPDSPTFMNGDEPLGEAEQPEIIPPMDQDGNIKAPWNTMTGCIAWFLSSTGKALTERQIRDEIRKIMVFLRKSTGQAYSTNAWRDVRKWLQNGHFQKTADNLWTLGPNHDYCDNCRNRQKKPEPGMTADAAVLVRCNLCPRSYHVGCVYMEAVPVGPWACPRHIDPNMASASARKRRRPLGEEGDDHDSDGDDPPE